MSDSGALDGENSSQTMAKNQSLDYLDVFSPDTAAVAVDHQSTPQLASDSQFADYRHYAGQEFLEPPSPAQTVSARTIRRSSIPPILPIGQPPAPAARSSAPNPQRQGISPVLSHRRSVEAFGRPRSDSVSSIHSMSSSNSVISMCSTTRDIATLDLESVPEELGADSNYESATSLEIIGNEPNETDGETTLHRPIPHRPGASAQEAQTQTSPPTMGHPEATPQLQADLSHNSIEEVPLDAEQHNIDFGNPSSSPLRKALHEDLNSSDFIQPTKVGYHSGNITDDGIETMSLSTSKFSMAFPNHQAVYYPTPIPAKLKLPPLLSKRNQSNKRPTIANDNGDVGIPQPNRQSKRRSAILSLNLEKPPQWGPSPLDAELSFESSDGRNFFVPTEAFDQSLEMNDSTYNDSDLDSDRATIMTGEDSEDYRDLESANFGNEQDAEVAAATRKNKAKYKKSRQSWLASTWTAFTGKDGHTRLEDQMGDGNDFDNSLEMTKEEDDEIAFSRYDPETIRKHAEMFHAGGVYSSTVPGNANRATSLIEEIEIRKAGRRMQNRILYREIQETERSRTDDPKRNSYIHPVDQKYKPSMLEMQYMANKDYRDRVSWHEKMLNHDIDRSTDHVDDRATAGESLAARRRRLRETKAQTREKEAKSNETLSERRERLRKQRAHAENSIQSAQSSEPSPQLQEETQDPESNVGVGTPQSVAESFDYAQAIAERSPGSLIVTSPVR